MNKVSPLTIGGSELRLREISRRLASHGHEVHVVCGKNLPKLPNRQQVDGVHIRNVTVLPSWLFRFRKLSFFLAQYLFYFLSLPAIFRSARKVDVVVDCATPVVSGASIISKLLGKPCVVAIYETFGRNWFRLKGPVTATLGYLAEVFFFAQTYDAYITLSRQTVAAMVDRGKPPERIHHLRHGVGVHLPAQPVRPLLGGSPEVVCLCRLIKQKNVASLLKVWKSVTEELGRVRLRIVGDGPERENLEKLADALSISGSVTFEGCVTEEQKWALLSRASAFAFPSLQEGFGIALVEAMAAGLPVVAYDLPIFREFLNDGEHGYLVPLDDHRQMADRLLKLLRNDSLRREISYRNAEYAGQFSWERATEQEESTLLSVLAGRREHSG
ncbi:MAG: glycosyltransferase family 4 protein [Rubrobacter sp.]|nr:glycosyltransferase family 4 protein [Rubrobacter sp.]